MAAAPYGGLILAGLTAAGGALQSQAPATLKEPTTITLAKDEVTRVKDLRVACATAEYEANETMPGSPYTLRVALYENGKFTAPRVSVALNGTPLIRVACSAEWAMLAVAPGTYSLSAAMSDGTVRTTEATVPVAGMARIVIGSSVPEKAPVS